LLNSASLLAPEDISLVLLAEASNLDLFDAGRGVAALAAFSLLSVREGSVSIHRLVQLVAREALADQLDLTATRVLAAVVAALPESRHSDALAATQRLLPHGLAVVRCAFQARVALELAARFLERL